MDKIGAGHFGCVYKAMLTNVDSQGYKLVAVKTSKHCKQNNVLRLKLFNNYFIILLLNLFNIFSEREFYK